MTILNVATSGLLVVAALSRGLRSPTRRTVAVALLGAAIAVLLAESASQVARWSVVFPVERAHLTDVMTLAQLVAVTVSGSATFALARRVSHSPALVPLPPAPLGMAVALAQSVLWAAASHRTPPDQPILHAVSAETVAIMVVTIAWPALAASALIPPLRAFTPAVVPPSVRFGLRSILIGICVLGLATVITGSSSVITAGSLPLSTAASVLSSVGLTAIAVGVLAAPTARLARPQWIWLRCEWATRQLAPLTAALSSATPEWTHPVLDRSTALTRPEIRLYQQIILIRDASWTLLGGVDGGVVSHGVAFAQAHVPRRRERDVAALAEACWLRHALHHRATRMPVQHDELDQGIEILQRDPGEPAGTILEEVEFLVAVARFWRQDKLLDQFLAQLHPWHDSPAPDWE